MTDRTKPTGWFDDMLTRREANRRVAATAMTAASVSWLAACKKDGEEAEHDARELQEQQGWNVGSTDASLSLPSPMDVDSRNNADWAAFATSDALVQALRADDEAWRPYESPVLFQSLSQSSLREQIRPILTDEMRTAWARGRAIGRLVAMTDAPESTLVVLDLPGAESVAAAAGMSRDVAPVFFFDNWPHPQGITRSGETLAASIFFAREIAENHAAASSGDTGGDPGGDPKGPPNSFGERGHVIVLDSNRLTPYTDAANEFDNRYMALLPSASALQERGIQKVLYVTADSSQRHESDDINETLVEWRDARIPVNLLAMDAFEPDPNATGLADGGSLAGEPVQDQFYGGAQDSNAYFYRHYPGFIFFYTGGGGRYGTYYTGNPRTPARVTRPTYTPQPRRTMFSGRTTGGAAGVGRQRPSGFGRVTTRAGSSGLTVRSGSTGRYHSSSNSG